MILGFSFILGLYMVRIARLSWGFSKVPHFSPPKKVSKIKFSIIIPFRNEAKHLKPLLTSLSALDYPKSHFEVICVDDASEDNSVALINTFLKAQQSPINLRVISNIRQTNAPKKDAITTAIKQASQQWILTTDADCIVPKHWLERYSTFIQHTNATCVAGPVMYTNTNTFLNRFQVLDLLSLQGATIGGFGLQKPFLCNGANLAYTQSLFAAVNGFEGNTDISSGDDIFLLEKALKHSPNKVSYLKCDTAIVKTDTQASWQDLIQQRIRWAAKTGAYNNTFAKTTGLIVLLMNMSLILLPALYFLHVVPLQLWATVLILKVLTDSLLLYKAALFFKQLQALKSLLLSFLLYPLFSSYVVVLALGKGYQWKGRSFKK